MHFIYVCFFSCVHTPFFDFVFAKLVMRSFCLGNFCVLLHVLTCVVQNQLIMNSLASLFFVFVYAFACLPYFLKCFLAVLGCFFLPNCSNLPVCVFAGYTWCHFLDRATQIRCGLVFFGVTDFNWHIFCLIEFDVPFCSVHSAVSYSFRACLYLLAN